MKSGKHHIEALAALLLFAAFALCILAVLLSGSRVFSRISVRDGCAFTARTIDSYLATKLRQSDASGAISIDGETLILSEKEGYETRIYCHDGYIYELFTHSDALVQPEAGEKLLPADSMLPQLSGGLLRIDIASEAGETELLYAIRSGEEAAP